MEEYASVFVDGIVARAHEDDHALPMLESVKGMSNKKTKVRELQLANYV